MTSPVVCKTFGVIKTKANAGPLHTAQKLNNLSCWDSQKNQNLLNKWPAEGLGLVTVVTVQQTMVCHDPTGQSWFNIQGMKHYGCQKSKNFQRPQDVFLMCKAAPQLRAMHDGISKKEAFSFQRGMSKYWFEKTLERRMPENKQCCCIPTEYVLPLL